MRMMKLGPVATDINLIQGNNNQSTLCRQSTVENITRRDGRSSGENYRASYLSGSNAQLMSTLDARKSRRGSYLSPNNTLVQEEATTDTLGKLQLKGLNPRALNGMFFGSMAQPNEYCASGRIGQIPNGTLKSNHYLMPTNNNGFVDDDQDKAQFYFGHLKLWFDADRQSSWYQSRINVNSSESENNESSSTAQLISSTAYERNTLGYMSRRKYYKTTNSFGRQALVE